MANRIVLNTISYHGHGAIENIVPELQGRGYKKVFLTVGSSGLKRGSAKVAALLDAAGIPTRSSATSSRTRPSRTSRAASRPSRPRARTASWPWAAARSWTRRRPSASS